MFILDDGIRLNAKIDMPYRCGEKCPLVIVIHGFTGHMEERHITAVSATLNEIGYATLRVDMYGHGSSDGRFYDHTLFKWLSNAMTVIDYAHGLEWVSDLYLCGHSQGGLTVMLAAAMKHELIRGLIPMSPAIMIPEQAREGSLLGGGFDPRHVPDEVTRDGREWILSGNYIRVAQTIYAEKIFPQYTGPVLLIHGDQDEAVPFHYSVEAEKAYQNAKLVRIPGDTHCYDYHLEMVTDTIRAWMPRVV